MERKHRFASIFKRGGSRETPTDRAPTKNSPASPREENFQGFPFRTLKKILNGRQRPKSAAPTERTDHNPTPSKAQQNQNSDLSDLKLGVNRKPVGEGSHKCYSEDVADRNIFLNKYSEDVAERNVVSNKRSFSREQLLPLPDSQELSNDSISLLAQTRIANSYDNKEVVNNGPDRKSHSIREAHLRHETSSVLYPCVTQEQIHGTKASGPNPLSEFYDSRLEQACCDTGIQYESPQVLSERYYCKQESKPDNPHATKPRVASRVSTPSLHAAPANDDDSLSIIDIHASQVSQDSTKQAARLQLASLSNSSLPEALKDLIDHKISPADSAQILENSRCNTSDTNFHSTWATAVTKEAILPEVTVIREEQITREIHNHDVYHRILPIRDTQVLPARHFIRSSSDQLFEIPTSIPSYSGAQQN